MPPQNDQRRPGRGGAAGAYRTGSAEHTATRPVRQAFRLSPRYRHLTNHLHQLGPRPVAEVLLLVASGRDLLATLEEYAALDPQLVACLGGRHWPPPPLRAVA